MKHFLRGPFFGFVGALAALVTFHAVKGFGMSDVSAAVFSIGYVIAGTGCVLYTAMKSKS